MKVKDLRRGLKRFDGDAKVCTFGGGSYTPVHSIEDTKNSGMGDTVLFVCRKTLPDSIYRRCIRKYKKLFYKDIDWDKLRLE